MKYYRYMSLSEFCKLMTGETIRRIRSDCLSTRSQASDDDICFLGETTAITLHGGVVEQWNAVMCYEFLIGVVSHEVLVEFESDEMLRKGQGTYADPDGDLLDIFSLEGVQTIQVDEYYCKEYNNRTMRPTRCLLDVLMIYSQYVLPRHCTNLDDVMKDIEFAFKTTSKEM